jgi:hypothetical protein
MRVAWIFPTQSFWRAEKRVDLDVKVTLLMSDFDQTGLYR